MNRPAALLIAALPLLLAPCFASQGDAPAGALDGPLEASPAQSKEARAVAMRLKGGHYHRQALDDQLSEHIFERYLNLLDPWHDLFTAADLTELARYRHELDDALRTGRLASAFRIFEVYQQRQEAQDEVLLAWARTGAGNVDLDDEEYLEIDRSESPWPKDQAEQIELWRLRFENDVLAFRLDKDQTDVAAALERRYQNQQRFSKRTGSEDVFELFLNAVAQSYDPHTQYLGHKSAQDFDIDMSLSVEGIGAELGNTGEFVSIERLIPGGPAERSGELSASDRIVAVAQGDEEFEDVVGWRTDEVAELVRGPAGSLVRLQILSAEEPAGSPPRQVSITREAVSLESQAAQSHVIEAGDGKRIGVIELRTFYMDFEGYQRGDPDYRSTARDVARLLQEFQEQSVEGVVLDLRGNGGGSLVEVNDLGGLFIGQEPVVQVRDGEDDVEVLRPEKDALYRGPLLVLVDRLSASASEIFAGAVQDHGRGLVVGERTFGKGTVQGILPVTMGELILTQAKFYRVTGQSTQLRGVAPDLVFPDGYDADEIGEEALPGALPWDEIRQVEGLGRGRERVLRFLPDLRERHRERVAGDAGFQRQEQRFEHLESLAHEERIPLQEAARRREQEEHEARQLAIENEYRRARGVEPLGSVAELEQDLRSEAQFEEELDPFQLEAARILADYVDLALSR
jgi:carboxyl-terminal processing protease